MENLDGSKLALAQRSEQMADSINGNHRSDLGLGRVLFGRLFQVLEQSLREKWSKGSHNLA